MTLLAMPAGCQMLRTEHRFWHPAGCDFLPCLNRGYRVDRPPATFWHPSRMSLANFSASHLFHWKQRGT